MLDDNYIYISRFAYLMIKIKNLLYLVYLTTIEIFIIIKLPN